MSKIEKLVIATRNSAKVNYYRELLSDHVNQILDLNDLNIEGKPEETGDSAQANAEIKARYYSQKTSLPVFSEDECLYVDFLPSEHQPGVHVRRVNGRQDASDDELLQHWENLVCNAPSDKRTGYWRFAFCVIYQGQTNTIVQDFPTKFFYPASSVRVPGWPLSSIQGTHGKPYSEDTIEEKQLSQKDNTHTIAKSVSQLFASLGI